MYSTATIAAVATAAGPGAIGIVRVSGAKCAEIIRIVAERVPRPRHAALQTMYNENRERIDRGLVIYFAGPASYTGEDMVEFHTHGGPAILARLLQTIYSAGAEPARPGEFTERAFLNGKIDLLQAEAVADLITVSSAKGLRSANLAIAGHFSGAINAISATLKESRARLEATIDFSEETSVDDALPFLFRTIQRLRTDVEALFKNAQKGARLARGLRVVLIGRPNAGKSTLMNALSSLDRAIVSDQPGTTRDVLLTEVVLEGLLITLIDTAGLHSTTEEIEREGIRRALAEVATADLLLCLYDANEPRPRLSEMIEPGRTMPGAVIYVRNKIDILGETPSTLEIDGYPEVRLSAKESRGLDLLRAEILAATAIESEGDCPLLARARHLHALFTAVQMLSFSKLEEFVLDLVESAERLRIAHQALGELTGDFTSEDLLGEIFSRFCVGK